MFIPSVQTVWSSDRVLPLSMRYATLALRRDVLRVGCNSSEVSSMSKIEWPGWLKWEGIAAVVFAWSGLFVAYSCFLKSSRSVHLALPIYCFLHFLHWIIYVRFVESQVIWYLICLVSPVLVKVNDVFPWLMYGQVRQPCLELQRNVPAGGLAVLSLFPSFTILIV